MVINMQVGRRVAVFKVLQGTKNPSTGLFFSKSLRIRERKSGCFGLGEFENTRTKRSIVEVLGD